MTETIHEILSAHRFLSGVPEGTVEVLAECARAETFEAGRLLLREGDVADTFHLIHRGRVSIEIHGPGRGRHILDTVGPGLTVGLSWAAPPFRCQFDARALEPVVAVAVDSECLRARLGENPAIGYALLERLASVLIGRLQVARVRLLDLYGNDSDR
jgi:CRP-like cAMP-binding protein